MILRQKHRHPPVLTYLECDVYGSPYLLKRVYVTSLYNRVHVWLRRDSTVDAFSWHLNRSPWRWCYLLWNSARRWN